MARAYALETHSVAFEVRMTRVTISLSTRLCRHRCRRRSEAHREPQLSGCPTMSFNTNRYRCLLLFVYPFLAVAGGGDGLPSYFVVGPGGV